MSKEFKGIEYDLMEINSFYKQWTRQLVREVIVHFLPHESKKDENLLLSLEMLINAVDKEVPELKFKERLIQEFFDSFESTPETFMQEFEGTFKLGEFNPPSKIIKF